MNPEYLEAATCPLCSHAEFKVIHDFEEFKSVKCCKCGMAYLTPRLKESEIQSLYEANDYFEKYADNGYSYKNQEKSLRKTFRGIINIIKKKKLAGGRLLEVGCAQGLFLQEARPYFSHLAGIDFCGEALAESKKHADEVWQGNVNTIPENVEKFDVIVAHNVIEHVYNPLLFMEELSKRLNNNGAVIIATPKYESFWFKIMGKKWQSYKVPEHVCFYTYKNLERLCLKTGFTKTGKFFYEHYFSLDLVFSKLNITKLSIKSSEMFNLVDIIIPDVMTAIIARKG